jgi:uncharacterized RDD family membrane protein YckC
MQKVAEVTCEATFGHYVMDLTVKSADGNMISLRQAVIRRCFDIIEVSWRFVLIAFLVVKNNPNHQRIGDQVAGTVVTDRKTASPKIQFDFEQTDS